MTGSVNSHSPQLYDLCAVVVHAGQLHKHAFHNLNVAAQTNKQWAANIEGDIELDEGG